MNVPFASSGQNKTVRDCIISILSEEFPLSTKEVYARVQRQIQKEVTYQATHKVLKELTEQHVLVKTRTKYQLDDNWIQKLKHFSRGIERKYLGEKDIDELLKNVSQKPVHLKFNDLSDAATTVATILAERKLAKEGNKYYALLNHGWWPLRFNFSDFILIHKMNSNYPGSFAIITQNTPFDQFIQHQYISSVENANGYCIIEKKAGPVEHDLISIGEFVIHAHYSEATKNYIEKIYCQINGLQDLLQFYFHNRDSKFTPEIDLTIEHNPTLSQFIAEKTQRHMRANKEYQLFMKGKKLMKNR